MKIRWYVAGLLCGWLSLVSSSYAVTIIAPYETIKYDQALSFWWEQTAAKSPVFTIRLAGASAWLLGKPYLLFPNGEGPQGQIDQAPLYRSDAFDCTTYVVTAIALAQSQNIAVFKQHYQNLMYKHGQVDFFHRNHFASIDFNENNEASGAFINVTSSLGANNHQISIQTLTSDINKPAWYQRTGLQRVRLLTPPSQRQLKQIQQWLKSYQNLSQDMKVSVDYIPTSVLIKRSGEVNLAMLKQIPNGSLIEIVYRDPKDIADFGTNLQIAHMGFVFDTSHGQVFREASSLYDKVIDIPLSVELRNLQQDPTVLGIHVEKITS